MNRIRLKYPITSRVAEIIWAFVIMGVILGAVEGASVSRSPFGIIIGVYFGAIGGLCCSPIGIFFFWRKNIRQAQKLLVVATIPVVVIATHLIANPFKAMLIVLLVFVLGCFALRMFLSCRLSVESGPPIISS